PKKDAGNNKDAAAGTKPAAKSSESGIAKADESKPKSTAAKVGNDAKDDADKKDHKRYSGPTTAARSREVPTMRAGLADYLATNKSGVDRNEAGWLIASWGAGPGVILLDPSLSWQRSELSPLETYLDQNGDGAFSREEIAQADAMLQKADVDSNDVIAIDEI